MKKVLTIALISAILMLLVGCPPTTGSEAVVHAGTPVFSGDLANATYVITAPATLLNGTATVQGGGTISYQWYKNTTNSSEGGVALSGATLATYSPPTDVAGTSYYYVVATNTITDNSDGGQKSATKTSTVATIIVDTKIYRVKATLNGAELTISPDYESNSTYSNFGSTVKGVSSADKEKITKVIISVPEGATIMPETFLFYEFGANYGETAYSSLIEIVGLEHLDTSLVTSMHGMFAGCVALTSLDLRSFNTSKVTDMANMFSLCNGLSELDLSSFDTSLVTTMYGMFRGCNALTSLDLSSFDTSLVTNMNYMFNGCNAITEAYGKTQADCDRFNDSVWKPDNVNFVVKTP